MIELTPAIVFLVLAGVFLCFLFAVLFLCTLVLLPLSALLAWYSWNAKDHITTLRENVAEMASYANLKDNVDHVLESLLDLAEILQEVNEMPVYSEEPIVVNMLHEIEKTLQEVERLTLDRDLLEFLEQKEMEDNVGR